METPLSDTPPVGRNLLFRLLAGCLLAVGLGALGLVGGWALARGLDAAVATARPADGSAKSSTAIDPARNAAPVQRLQNLPASYDTLFPDWPAEPKPDVLLAITGEMQGHLRPCGCSEGQNGGLARRAGLINFLKGKLSLNVVPLDLGDLIESVGMLEEERFKTAQEALKKIGYKASAAGRAELRLTFLTLIGNLGVDAAPDTLKFLLGNVQSDEKDMQTIVKEQLPPFTTVNAGDKKIAIAAILGDDAREELNRLRMVIAPPAEAARRLLKEMDAGKPDLKVLLANMSQAKAVELAQACSGFDVVVCRSKDDVAASRDAEVVGSTLVVWPGRKGLSMGFVGFWPKQSLRLRFAATAVDARFTEDPEQEKIYARFIEEIKSQNYLEKWPRVKLPAGEQYVGAAKCGECHRKAYVKWSSTKHAAAFESLKKDKALWQHFNPECVQCHTVGFDHVGGFVTEAKSPLLLGNQCENCHGPGKGHSQNKDDPALRAQMRRLKTDISKRCYVCHDADNSPHFKFDAYWEKIAHPWRD